MTLEQAVKHTEELIEWFIEGMAEESEERIRRDVDAMETLIRCAKAQLNQQRAARRRRARGRN